MNNRGPRRPDLRGVNATTARLLACVLGCAVLITIDRGSENDSVLDPARRGVGEVLGPAQVAAAEVVRPIAGIPDWVRTQGSLRDDVADLEAENSALRREVASSGYNKNRLAEYDELTAAAGESGHTLVPARVVALGPSQSFSASVTIDAGERSGLAPDMTVVNADGLVGRVLRVTSNTATVLLIIDPDSVVGGRVGNSLDMGMLSGRGVLGNEGRLDLELVDTSTSPAKGEAVVTWGSRGGAPYRSGIPVGRVTKVYESLRETAQRAEIRPFVDFAALDLVGVVVPSGTKSDRSLVEADGSVR